MTTMTDITPSTHEGINVHIGRKTLIGIGVALAVVVSVVCLSLGGSKAPAGSKATATIAQAEQQCGAGFTPYPGAEGTWDKIFMTGYGQTFQTKDEAEAVNCVFMALGMGDKNGNFWHSHNDKTGALIIEGPTATAYVNDTDTLGSIRIIEK